MSTPATTWTTAPASALPSSNAEQTISQEKYVSVTTFRKTGVAVATAIWIVPLEGGRVGLLTSSASGKAKRLRAQPERASAPERRPRPSQSRHHAGDRYR